METPSNTPSTAPAAATQAPEADIWASELGAKLKSGLIASPVTQADKDQNILLEYAAKNNLDVTRTASGLYYVVEKEGSGTPPSIKDRASVHYRGYFLDGREFDSSYKRNAPYDTELTAVIKGWTEALQLMKPGAKLKILVPSGLAYGERGFPGAIPPNSVMAFDMELVKVLK